MPPDDVHHALQSFKDTVVPFLETYDRICAVMVMVNRQAGVLQTSITVENREALEASRNRTQEMRDLITAAIPSVKIVEVFELEVVISDLRPSS
jgi:histidinol phosphatase-like enzyme